MAGALRMTEPQFVNYGDDNMQLPSFLSCDFIPPMEIKTEPYIPETAHGPYIQIIEEPKQRGFRFRYECEGPSHGGLPGASSEKNRRTYPTVKINNYVGHARVEVQLVTHTDPARVHAHSLVGRHCNENGTCSLDIGPNDLTASFSNLGILHVTKKGVVEVLTRRLRDERRRQKGTHCPLTDGEESSILKEAKELGKVMDLNIVRLRFTAFLQDSNGGFTRALKPVVSNPIYDSKSPNASNLKISRMDKTCGSVLGGDEIFLLCDKVQKDDIEIRFYEEDEDGCWEAFGDFSPTDVHKQYAIVFKTPPYHSAEIDRPVTVFLQLRRKKAGDSSDPKQFTYVPQVQDKEEVLRKKQKPLPHYDSWRGGRGRDGGPGAGGFGSGPGGPGGPGFQFSQMNGGPGGGAFFTGAFTGFTSGGGAQMSGSAPLPSGSAPLTSGSTPLTSGSTPQQGEGQPGSAVQQQLLRIAASLSSRVSQSARQTAAALLQYCSTGDARILLVLQRHLCGIQDANGDTPLHLAIIHQQTAVIQQLIQTLLSSQQHAVLNTCNHLQQTPLHLAVITRQLKVVEVLLRAGADPTLVDKDGRSPLHLAALAGDTATLRLLLAHLGERHTHLVNTPDYHGLQPLHLAIRRDGERCLRLLVEGGAKINAAELKSGNTPLHLAVRENLFKVACTLITELKADVNTCTFGGNTPLHLAASLGFPTLCSMLIAAGADKTMENDEPLYFSSSDEEAEADEPIGSRKRRARGHTPLDLATCQKVRNLLASRRSPKPSRHGDKKIRTGSEDGERSGLDEETLSRLVAVLSVGDVPWVKLAEKLGMMTLTHLYEDSATPCQHLLQHYKLGGGPVEGLVEALQALGLTEGVRLLRNTELRDDKHSSDATVDSGFSSQPMEEQQEEAMTNE
ncbi:nuclear factor NF-kappa-B p100 subunit isoform X1 [Poecilia formosa]|uniref:Nuclear factor of kappa light polypeptide gene enhancer in B-cells 2 (p49/p100) n=1 Tax=Poecilia formosa TaxID=48698 RepID=A0A087Y4C5_POEFO|nr:PREDICTED: nuclear factor NF-kappa-B p100 subunit isoform X1 [Poecilia formosa]